TRRRPRPRGAADARADGRHPQEGRADANRSRRDDDQRRHGRRRARRQARPPQATPAASGKYLGQDSRRLRFGHELLAKSDERRTRPADVSEDAAGAVAVGAGRGAEEIGQLRRRLLLAVALTAGQIAFLALLAADDFLEAGPLARSAADEGALEAAG